MGLADKLKDITKKAEETAAEHKDQIRQAVQKAGTAADQQTGGKYHEQIQKAGAKADTFVEGLKGAEESREPGQASQEPPAAGAHRVPGS